MNSAVAAISLIEQPDNWKTLDRYQRAMHEARLVWQAQARYKQLTPPGEWTTWLLMGGRGAGKTRTGAEDLAWYAGRNAGVRVAVVAPTSGDARDTCFEGVSGLCNVIPSICIRTWNRSLGELILWNDARFKAFSAEEPERLRGPQHHRAWCDEIGVWKYATETWDNLQFGLRLGLTPRTIVTTTPRPTELIRTILKDKGTVTTTESTFANSANLSESALNKLRERYEGTRLGRQELEAELLDDAPGALWRRAKIDETRRKPDEVPDLQRVVVGLDPATAAPDNEGSGLAETGIIIVGLGVDGRGYVLDDLSGRYLPEQWARQAVAGIDLYDGDAVVAETNQGGEMVRSTIRSARNTVKVVTVHASRGKVTRAEPVSALYEQGRVSHVGSHSKLEDQMVAFTSVGIVGDTTGDRVDALVWALTELFPRITRKRDHNASGPKVESAKEYQPHNF